MSNKNNIKNGYLHFAFTNYFTACLLEKSSPINKIKPPQRLAVFY